jgi:tRNA pseudouridine38-40 synthase
LRFCADRKTPVFSSHRARFVQLQCRKINNASVAELGATGAIRRGRLCYTLEQRLSFLSQFDPQSDDHTAVMRFKLTIEYAGTRYSGWQIQKNARTIQGELERAITETTGASSFELYGSGRTDAGVHALRQVAHLDIHTTLPADTLKRRINDALPVDIVITAVARVPHRFHARHDAVARSYIYQLSRRRTAFGKPFVWWVKDELDLDAMRRVGQKFLGLHDFQSFSDDDPSERSTEVMLDSLEIHEDGALIIIHLQGSHFIWKMVRRLVGVLVEVGRNGLTEAQAVAFLEQQSDIPARVAAPASGLFLERVYYPGDRRDESLQAATIVFAQ